MRGRIYVERKTQIRHKEGFVLSTDNRDRGAISEARFIYEAERKGWEVCQPFSGRRAYDFLVRRAPHLSWQTVQVKTAGNNCGKNQKPSLQVQILRGTQKRRYKDGDFDLLFVASENICWLIPWVEIRMHTKLSLQGDKYNRWLLK